MRSHFPFRHCFVADVFLRWELVHHPPSAALTASLAVRCSLQVRVRARAWFIRAGLSVPASPLDSEALRSLCRVFSHTHDWASSSCRMRSVMGLLGHAATAGCSALADPRRQALGINQTCPMLMAPNLLEHAPKGRVRGPPPSVYWYHCCHVQPLVRPYAKRQAGCHPYHPFVIACLCRNTSFSVDRSCDNFCAYSAVTGTGSCDVWEVDETPEVLVQGHASSLWGLAMNPAYPHVFATACDSDTVVVWSAASRKVID